jgi:hypothetical protein
MNRRPETIKVSRLYCGKNLSFVQGENAARYSLTE